MNEIAVTQSEVYRLFKSVDRLPGILEPRIGRWRAWPMVKMQLVWHLMNPPGDESGEGLDGKLWHRLKHGVLDAIAMLFRLPRLLRAPPANGAIGMLFVPRIHRAADGVLKDAIFGGLLRRDDLGLPVVPLQHRLWGASRLREPSLANAVDLDPYQSASELLAFALMASPALRRLADGFDRLLAPLGLPIDSHARQRKILLALAVFEARRRLFRLVLRRLGIRLLVLTYAPGRAGEIAAAKELGIPVIELQHGVISAHCPDYAWPAEYAPLKAELALPDQVAVFGPMFRREIMGSGFWTSEQIKPVGAAAMQDYDSGAHEGSDHDTPLHLLFMTQATVRAAAIEFWREFLRNVAPSLPDWKLSIKVHPEEEARLRDYEALAQLAPGKVRVLSADSHPFEAMLEADVVLAYNSMALFEAVGYGRLAISLCGGSIPQGLAGTFDLPGLVDVMPHLGSPEELGAIIRGRLADPAAREQSRRNALEYGRDFFSTGFGDAMAELIRAAVRR